MDSATVWDVICGSTDPFGKALETNSLLWPEVHVETGDLTSLWTTADAFFADAAAIEEYLDYSGSFHPGTDRKTCAASMMIDYCYVLSLATVPLLVGSRLVPDLSRHNYAFRFYVTSQEHDGQVFQIRRARVRFLSRSFWTDWDGATDHHPAHRFADHAALCQHYRRNVEEHLSLLVSRLYEKTRLSRSALWRLAGDTFAGHFLEAGRKFDCLDQAKKGALRILKHPGSPFNNQQMHFFTLTLKDLDDRELVSWDFRARGGCCRYYLVKPDEFCENCVLKDPKIRDAELLEIMRERYRTAMVDDT